MNISKHIRRAKRIYVIGNGGSFANAAHIANDLLARGVKAYSMDAAFLTATANDFGYDRVFARWVETVGEPGDLLIALSGSGKSENILNAIDVAEELEMDVIKLFGNEKNQNMQQAEEYQIEWGHRRCKSILEGK